MFDLKKDVFQTITTTHIAHSEAYCEGMKAGIREYAWYKDGIAYVGTSGKTLKDAITEIDDQRTRRLQALDPTSFTDV